MGGCASSPPVDSTIKPGSGVALNPSGTVAPSQAQYASQMSQAGNKMAESMKEQAAEMAAAKAKAGVK